jgi:soluble lytic murein transglycosylase-like protein
MRRAIATSIICTALLATPMSEGRRPHKTTPSLHPVSPIDDPLLITSIIAVESSGNPKAVSRKGAIGLMQVRWSCWKDELRKHGIANSRADLLDPGTNVRAGKFVLAFFLRKHQNDLKKALHGYSGGAKGYYKKVMEVRHERNR